MKCIKANCVFNSARKCGCAPMAGPGGAFETLMEAICNHPCHAEGCSSYMPEDAVGMDECTDNICQLGVTHGTDN